MKASELVQRRGYLPYSVHPNAVQGKAVAPDELRPLGSNLMRVKRATHLRSPAPEKSESRKPDGSDPKGTNARAVKRWMVR